MTARSTGWFVILVVAVSLLSVAGANARPTQRVGSDGVTIALPKGWHSATFTPSPGQHEDSNPTPRIEAWSGPVSASNGVCSAIYLTVVEWTRPPLNVFTRRPDRFTWKMLMPRPSPAWPSGIDCLNGEARGIEFTDHGRSFDALMLFGRGVPAGLAARALSVLNTLRVTRAHH